MTTTTVPCKRPKVTIEAHEVQFALSGSTGTYHLVTCRVPGCDFTYDAAVVTDAQFQAAYHRGQHREAVPPHVLSFEGPNLTHYASCFRCDVRTGPGVTTRVDAQMWLDHHLSTAHGLVK